MADNEKYYYMRLKENYFESNEISLLESMQDGYLYSNILLKLYLRSLRNNGKLMLNDRIPYNPQMIATITKHQVGTVEKALELFTQLGLVEILDNGAIYMLDLQNFVGKSSTEADRKRQVYQEIANEKRQLELGYGEISKKSPKKLPHNRDRIDIEIEKNIEDIILHLNAKTDSNYKITTAKTRTLIIARLKEGFTVEDFKTVIDKKSKQWLNNDDFKMYLRPETLFGNKFEGYLNEKETEKSKAVNCKYD